MPAAVSVSRIDVGLLELPGDASTSAQLDEQLHEWREALVCAASARLCDTLPEPDDEGAEHVARTVQIVGAVAYRGTSRATSDPWPGSSPPPL